MLLSAMATVVIRARPRMYLSRSGRGHRSRSRQLVAKSMVQYRVGVESWSDTAEDGRAESRGYNSYYSFSYLSLTSSLSGMFILFCSINSEQGGPRPVHFLFGIKVWCCESLS